jgi:ketosteroid isomerase-like protein
MIPTITSLNITPFTILHFFKKLFMRKASFFLMITVIMLACNAGTDEGTADAKSDSTAFDLQKARSFIESENAKFSDETKRGDSVALGAHYASDGLLMFSNSEPMKGKDIVSTWGSVIRMGVKDIRLTTVDLTGNAELLAETGTYEMFGENNAVIDKGKYIVVWKPENGNWKIYRDIGNTNLPPPAVK